MLTIEKQPDGNYVISYNGANIGQFIKKEGRYVWATNVIMYWTDEELYSIADSLAELNENNEEKSTVNPTTPPPK